MDGYQPLLFALAGAVVGVIAGLVPGVHIFNVAAAALVIGARLPAGPGLALLMIGLVVGWAMSSTIPSVFLFAPDDASAGAVLPATKYLLRGRGFDAVALISGGSLGGIAVLVALAPALDEVLRPIRQVISPHYGWMLVAVVAFLVLGEWPRGDMRAPTRLRRLLSAWAYLGAGLLTFALSGVLGFVLLYRSPVPLQAAYQNLMPAFAGLFAMPGLLQVLLFGARPPLQAAPSMLPAVTPYQWLRGTLTGAAGGLFAGLMPVVTGGIGGLLAGHATAQRSEPLFLISQGASKAAYYAGGLLLLFVPGLGLTRGGLAWMLTTVYVPYGWRVYWLAVAAVALCGALSFVLSMLLARGAARLASRLNPRQVAGPALALTVALTLAFTGPAGFAVALAATAIGLIPVLVGGRRMNCLGVLLLPITLNIVGVGPDVARWLGLL